MMHSSSRSAEGQAGQPLPLLKESGKIPHCRELLLGLLLRLALGEWEALVLCAHGCPGRLLGASLVQLTASFGDRLLCYPLSAVILSATFIYPLSTPVLVIGSSCHSSHILEL